MSLTPHACCRYSFPRTDYLIMFGFSNADTVSRKYIDTRLAAHVPPSRRRAGAREKTPSVMLARVWHPVVELQSRERIVCVCVLSYPENLSFSFIKWFSNVLIAIRIVSYSIRFPEINFYHHVRTSALSLTLRVIQEEYSLVFITEKKFIIHIIHRRKRSYAIEISDWESQYCFGSTKVAINRTARMRSLAEIHIRDSERPLAQCLLVYAGIKQARTGGILSRA